VFAEVVAVKKLGGDLGEVGGEHEVMPGHKGYLFQNHGVVDSLVRGGTPGEGAVAADENAGDGVFIFVGEGLDDDRSGLFFVGAVDLLGGHFTGAGHGAVEGVRMGGAENGNVKAALCHGCCPAAVGVDNSSDMGKGLVELKVGGCVAGGIVFSFHDLAGQIHNDHILCGHGAVLNAGGFYDHQPAFPVYAGNVAPGEGHKSVTGQSQIGFKNCFL